MLKMAHFMTSQHDDLSSSKLLRQSSRMHQMVESDEDDTTVENSYDEHTEHVCREEVQQWLSKHGKALFALESSKFLTAERRREVLKPRK